MSNEPSVILELEFGLSYPNTCIQSKWNGQTIWRRLVSFLEWINEVLSESKIK